MKRITTTIQALRLGLTLVSVVGCKREEEKSDEEADAELDPATVLRIEGTWANSVALTESERPNALHCVTLESEPRACTLKLNIEAFAGNCAGFAGVEFACFPRLDDQIVGYVDFENPVLPAYGIGTLHLGMTFDAATLSARATVVTDKTTAAAGAAPERLPATTPDLNGAWQLTRTDDMAVQWTAFDTAPQLFFEAGSGEGAATIGVWDNIGKRNACSDGGTSSVVDLFLKQGDKKHHLRVDSGAHFDADIDQWFGGLSDATKTRLRKAARYLSRYTPRPPCELSSSCLDGDFATLGPHDADTLRDRLTSSLLETPGVEFDCASHTVPKNFNFMQCGPSQLRACDVVKLSMDAPLGLELGSKGVLEVGEPPSGARFDASLEWLCPETYADLVRDKPDGADDVPAALLACRNEFLTLAPTAYTQAVYLEDWYNLSDMDYMLRCNPRGPTEEQQAIVVDLAASCTPDAWRTSECDDNGDCETTIVCPYGREDGKCVDQGAFAGHISGRMPSLQLHSGTGGSFILAGDRSGSAFHTVDGVALKCNQATRQRIYAVGSGDQMSGFYVNVSKEACETPEEVDSEPTVGDFFKFNAARLP